VSWLQRLAENKKAMERLETLLGNVLQDDDDGTYVTIEDVCEAFAILRLAHADPDRLDELADEYPETIPAFAWVELGHVEVYPELDQFSFIPSTDEPTHLAIHA